MNTSVHREIEATKEQVAHNVIMKSYQFLIDADQPALAQQWLEENLEPVGKD